MRYCLKQPSEVLGDIAGFNANLREHSKIIFLISGFKFMTMTSRQRSLPFYVDVLRWFRASEIEVIDLEAAKLVV